MNAESLFIILIFFKLSFSNSFYSVPILKRAIISRNYTQKREISRKASEISNVYIKDYDSMEYYGILSCGTPKKEYSVIFDSGSSDVWLESITCTNCGGQNFYDPDDSTTYESTSSSFSITYGSGKVSGIVGIDDFSVGDLNITGLKFGLAETEATAIASLKYLDGIVGLAFSSLAEFTLPTFLTLLDGQNDGDDDDADDNNMFSVYFDTSELQQSMITFRGYDSSLLQMYNQTWKVIPLVQSTVYAYWSISMDGLYVSSSSVYSSYAESVSTATAVVCQTYVCGSNSTHSILIHISLYNIWIYGIVDMSVYIYLYIYIFLSLIFFSAYRSSCIAIVDTGTSTIALSTSIYASVLASVTDGKNCNDDAVCFHTSVSEFPVLLFSFNTENVFPLLPARYVKCTGTTILIQSHSTACIFTVHTVNDI